MGIARFVLGRLAGMVVVLLIIALVTFVVFYLLPSDPARMSCGRPCSPESLATAKSFMQLDQPWYQQFLSFLSGIFAGRTFGSGVTAIHCPAPCFGYSFQQNEETLHLILSRLPVTASIAAGAAIIWLLTGVGVGVLSALRPGRPVDRIAMAGAVAGVSTPVFLTGLIGILVLGFTLDMVPTHGYVQLADSPVDWAWHLVLPWLVLAFLHGALYARLTRNQMLEVLGEDYIRTARAKGLTEARVVRRHALRNVLLPVVTVFGIDLGGLLGGAVITERVFAMPGVGSLMVDAVHAVDLPLLLGCTLFGAALIVVANFVVDVLYGVLDPRVRLN
ncbi:ABC transporter permease [Actinophytocola sp.]|uniref:ABC transporter permease n=1 Tax=Actinophytocola sp. TaxID=1872138 RepID=UPI002D6B23A8|nr:ABC transporter permease [Actinophytocola sp.]HYQ67299.1 ABC transporter permease [Actinophytocola sp.]